MSKLTATTAAAASNAATLVAAGNFQVIMSSRAVGPPYPICSHFSCRRYTVTRSIGPHRITIMQRDAKKLHENQHLGWSLGQRVPRKLGSAMPLMKPRQDRAGSTLPE